MQYYARAWLIFEGTVYPPPLFLAICRGTDALMFDKPQANAEQVHERREDDVEELTWRI